MPKSRSIGTTYVLLGGSSSGTFINTYRLSPFKAELVPFELNHGDVVQLGQTYADDGDPQSLCVRIRVELEDDTLFQIDNATIVPEASNGVATAGIDRRHLPITFPVPSSNSPYRLPIDRLNEYFSLQRDKYSEVDIDQINELLDLSHELAYSRIPRVYIVLRLIDRLDDIDLFLNSEVSDVSFPFSASSLLTSLEPNTVHKFLGAQKVVLTKALDLEKDHDGKHVVFEPGEPLPFEVRGLLGRGAYAL